MRGGKQRDGYYIELIRNTGEIGFNPELNSYAIFYAEQIVSANSFLEALWKLGEIQKGSGQAEQRN